MLAFSLGLIVMAIVLFTNNPIAHMATRMLMGKYTLYDTLKGDLNGKTKENEDEYIDIRKIQ